VIESIFDTNIIIYLLEGETKYLNFLGRKSLDKNIGISIITYMEVLVGISEEKFDAVSNFLNTHFNIIRLNERISYFAARNVSNKIYKGFRTSKLADSIIANTALDLGVPLVTNNPKDFKKFKGLEVIVP